MAMSPNNIVPLKHERAVDELELERRAVETEGRAASTWSYKFAVLFLAVYYIRPQDWLPGMAGFNIVRTIMLGWGMILIGEGSQSPVRGWFRTPHDWTMLAFYVYVVWNAPSEAGATMGMFSLVVFYYLTTQALSSWQNVLGYLKAWNALLLMLAIMGVLQTMGMDITGGKSNTEMFKGRLSLGTWMADNPNSLGHSVVAVIPLSFVLFFWKGSALGRMILFPTCASLAIWCAWQTQSKGAFVVGGVLTVLALAVGRPKWVQILLLSAAMTVGVGALSFLPRMESMGDLSSDEGVLGRLMAWDMARTAMEHHTYGVGWRQFVANIIWREGNYYEVVPKSTHCSYVQIGADLGKYGLFVWLLGLWTAMRTIIFFKSEDETEERCRRGTILLVSAYAMSNWMINREYHTEYFLLIAVAASIHRLRQAEAAAAQQNLAGVESDGPESDLSQTPALQLHASIVNGRMIPALVISRDAELDEERPVVKKGGILLNLAVAALLTWLVLAIWDQVLAKMLFS
jgi:hypothetical protein